MPSWLLRFSPQKGAFTWIGVLGLVAFNGCAIAQNRPKEDPLAKTGANLRQAFPQEENAKNAGPFAQRERPNAYTRQGSASNSSSRDSRPVNPESIPPDHQPPITQASYQQPADADEMASGQTQLAAPQRDLNPTGIDNRDRGAGTPAMSSGASRGKQIQSQSPMRGQTDYGQREVLPVPSSDVDLMNRWNDPVENRALMNNGSHGQGNMGVASYPPGQDSRSAQFSDAAYGHSPIVNSNGAGAGSGHYNDGANLYGLELRSRTVTATERAIFLNEQNAMLRSDIELLRTQIRQLMQRIEDQDQELQRASNIAHRKDMEMAAFRRTIAQLNVKIAGLEDDKQAIKLDADKTLRQIESTLDDLLMDSVSNSKNPLSSGEGSSR